MTPSTHGADEPPSGPAATSEGAEDPARAEEQGGSEDPLDALLGVAGLTRRGAEGLVRLLVQQGELAADRAERTVEALLARSEQNRSALGGAVRSETARLQDLFGLARRAELDELAARVEQLDTALAALTDRVGGLQERLEAPTSQERLEVPTSQERLEAPTSSDAPTAEGPPEGLT